MGRGGAKKRGTGGQSQWWTTWRVVDGDAGAGGGGLGDPPGGQCSGAYEGVVVNADQSPLHRRTHLVACHHPPRSTTTVFRSIIPGPTQHTPALSAHARARARRSYVDVHEDRLADAVDLGNDTLEVERLCEHDLEDFLHVDGCGC